MVDGRDHWCHDLMAEAVARLPARAMDSEDLLYLLYTSGTTAKPKGIMHTTGGYLTQVAFTHKYVFDLHPETDVYWCAADIGWVTGHSYIVYGPLANGATSVIYEGTPDTPGTRPPLGHRRALRRDPALHRAHRHPHVHEVGRRRSRREHDLSSLRVLGTVGEPINPEAWMWYHEHIGGEPLPDRRHVVADRDRRPHDHARCPGVTTTKPARPPSRCPASAPRWSTTTATASSGAAATSRSPGRGRRCCAASGATPSATARRTGRATRAGTSPATAAKLDDDGYLWLLGRVDDVMNVSGHRISTTEVESALVDHPAVAEAAVVGANDDDHRPGDHRLRHPARQRTSRATELGRGDPPARRHEDRRDRPAQGGDRRRPTSQDPLAARSCAACCATWPRAATLGDTTTLADSGRGRGDPRPGRRRPRRRTDRRCPTTDINRRPRGRSGLVARVIVDGGCPRPRSRLGVLRHPTGSLADRWWRWSAPLPADRWSSAISLAPSASRCSLVARRAA